MSNTPRKNDKLIAEQYSYVVNLAEKFCARRGIADVEEFVSRAAEALVVEGRKWDEKRGQKFRTFIHQRVTWALLRLCKAEMERDEVFVNVYSDLTDDIETPTHAVMEPDHFIDEEEPDPMDLAIEAERIEELYKQLENILPREKRALLALYVQGMTLDEAAEDMDVPATTVRRLRDSGLAKLQGRMKQCA